MIPDDVIIRAGTNMLAHTDMVPLEYVRQLEKDAERYRWLRQRLVGASFDWDDEGMSVLVFEMPDGVSIGADCDKNIDAAMQRTTGREGER